MKKIIYKNQWFKIVNINKWFFIEENYQDGAVILIKIKDSFLFVKNFRVPINKYSLELPRGYNNENETSIKAAIRETYEETGLFIKEKQLQKLGSIYPNSGILNSEIDVFFVEIEQCNKLTIHDNDEISKILKIKIDKIPFLIKKGIIKDSFSLSSLYLYNNIILNK